MVFPSMASIFALTHSLPKQLHLYSTVSPTRKVPCANPLIENANASASEKMILLIMMSSPFILRLDLHLILFDGKGTGFALAEQVPASRLTQIDRELCLLRL